MFNDNIFNIDPLDIIYFLPLLESWLKKYIKFNKLDFFTFTIDNETSFLRYLDKILITKRNIKRINEAIKNGKGFWDRPSNKAFIPLKISENSYNVIVIYGIDKSIGPEESSRLLPILQDSIFLYLTRNKTNQLLCPQNKPPVYLETILNTVKHITTNDYILTIEFNSQIKKLDDILLQIQHIIEDNNIKYKIIGTSLNKHWYILYDTKDIQKLIKSILINKQRIYKYKLSIYASKISDYTNKQLQISTVIDDIEKFKKLSNLNIIISEKVKLLCNKFNSDKLIYLLEKTAEYINIRYNYIIICMLIDKYDISKVIKILSHHDIADHIINEPNNSIFFIIKKLTKKASLSEEVEKFTSTIAPQLFKEQYVKHIGIAFKGHKFINKKQLPFLSLMTMIHASMLGNYKLAVYNDITFNVIGDEFLSFGDITGAIKHFKLGLKINPNNANLYNSLGVCLAELGKIREAHNMFLKAVEFKPDDFMIQYNLAGSYIVKRDIKNAINALKTAYQLNSKDINIAVKLSSLLLKTSNSKEVIDILKPFIEPSSNCKSIAAYKLLSRAYINQQNWKEAKRLLKTALKIKPSDPETLAILALGYLECAKDPGTAIRFTEQAEARVNNNSETLKELLYNIRLKLENYDTYNILKTTNK